MRNTVTLIILMVMAVITGCTPKPDVALINFKSQIVDIGYIKPNSRPVNVTFSITNNGGKALLVHNVASDCSCAVASFTKKPIAAGDTGSINIKLDPKLISAKGHYERPIVVHSNTKPRLHTLIIKMFVDR